MENISNSNIKLILEFYLKNKNSYTLNDIYHFYKPTQGYLYCLFNEIFKFYDDDLYKCGNSIDTDKRLCQYTTSYPMPSEILLTSDVFFDKSFAETLLFYYLKDYKFKPNREFIKCNFNLIKEAFDKVKQFFITHNNKNLLVDFLLKDDNFKIFFNNSNNILSDDDIFFKNTNKIKKILNILNLNYFDFSNEHQFIDYISKYLFNLNFNQFNNIFNTHHTCFNKYKSILDKINTCFWFENILNIKRLYINDIPDDIIIDDVLNKFTNNVDNFVCFFKTIESKNKTIQSINNKIDKIKLTKPLFKNSHFQKFIAECYNNIINNIISIERKDIIKKRHYRGSIYIFNLRYF